jgi:hypothetical protein
LKFINFNKENGVVKIKIKNKKSKKEIKYNVMEDLKWCRQEKKKKKEK